MNFFTKAYYKATGFVPRTFPQTPESYKKFKAILKDAYGVPDEPRAWMTVAGHVCSTPAAQMKRPWAEIANAAKRMNVNEIAQMDKNEYLTAFRNELAEAMKAEAEATDGIEAQEIVAETYVEPKQEAPEAHTGEAQEPLTH